MALFGYTVYMLVMCCSDILKRIVAFLGGKLGIIYFCLLLLFLFVEIDVLPLFFNQNYYWSYFQIPFGHCASHVAFFVPAFLCIYYLLIFIFIRYRNKTKKPQNNKLKKVFLCLIKICHLRMTRLLPVPGFLMYSYTLLIKTNGKSAILHI